MQTILIKIEDSKLDFFMELIKNLDIVEEVQINQTITKFKKKKSNNLIQQPKGVPSISDFKGFWHNNPKTLKLLREKAWKRT
jgi:hypothetical protein